MTPDAESDHGRISELFEALRAHDSADAEWKAARDHLVELHLPLVGYIVRRFAGRGESVDDLMQIGTVGLIQAIDRFEPERGLAFSTFATPTIAGEIRRHFRDKGWMIRVPRRLQELQIDLAAAIAELSQTFGRSPTVAEIATRLELSPEAVLEGLESARAYAAVPIDVPNAAGVTLAEQIAETEDDIEAAELRHVLRAALADLSDRERTAVLMRVLDHRTQSEIAESLGVSQVHVSRILAKTLSVLKEKLADLGGASD